LSIGAVRGNAVADDATGVASSIQHASPFDTFHVVWGELQLLAPGGKTLDFNVAGWELLARGKGHAVAAISSHAAFVVLLAFEPVTGLRTLWTGDSVGTIAAFRGAAAKLIGAAHLATAQLRGLRIGLCVGIGVGVSIGVGI
jgi:hypothetical protein